MKDHRLFPRVPTKKPEPAPATPENVKRVFEEATNPDPRPYLEGLLEDALRIEAASPPGGDRATRARAIWHATKGILANLAANRAGPAVVEALGLAELLRDDLLTRPHVKGRSVEWLAGYGQSQAGWLAQEVDRERALAAYNAHRAEGHKVTRAMELAAADLGCSTDTIKRARGKK